MKGTTPVSVPIMEEQIILIFIFLTMMTGFTAFVAILIFTGMFMRKVHLRRAQKKVCHTFNNVTETIYMEHQQQDIEPYDTFTRKDCTLYSTLQLTNPNS
ncbi:hypothetical protein UPYG_G00021160 [Umbra pygmaea]|uniref:Uncharacterized protein n=1 Tax=Umbra pygmaea TaxID=75934 RepID=A0ABD0XMZ2_UMBPY